MSETGSKHIDAEHIQKWQRLDELDSSAISGKPITAKQFQAYCASIKNGTYLQEDLQAVQKQKQKLLQTLSLLEEIEKTLQTEITRTNQFH
ncbi:hypothetical protein F7734_18090 [Scytonema sp. UIC 10036]|jgi:hypothetical protein|uniref:hypothetical protein n=1 Tax=Scytonema sp. UIC 10036 TaxID=2304196 RepID=UPI0012DA07E0|nr:hypothetical protein [Scytonema sp. UIC 10036]MUG94193.1 hypothetical protein [Scytonema sp. UIC 10036]